MTVECESRSHCKEHSNVTVSSWAHVKYLRDRLITVQWLWYSGKLVLDSLGFDVEVYYASEIDSDAMMVTKLRHRDSVTQVGDVRKLTADEVWYRQSTCCWQ